MYCVKASRGPTRAPSRPSSPSGTSTSPPLPVYIQHHSTSSHCDDDANLSLPPPTTHSHPPPSSHPCPIHSLSRPPTHPPTSRVPSTPSHALPLTHLPPVSHPLPLTPFHSPTSLSPTSLSPPSLQRRRTVATPPMPSMPSSPPPRSPSPPPSVPSTHAPHPPHPPPAPTRKPTRPHPPPRRPISNWPPPSATPRSRLVRGRSATSHRALRAAPRPKPFRASRPAKSIATLQQSPPRHYATNTPNRPHRSLSHELTSVDDHERTLAASTAKRTSPVGSLMRPTACSTRAAGGSLPTLATSQTAHPSHARAYRTSEPNPRATAALHCCC
jgi:hypothetical protein